MNQDNYGLHKITTSANDVQLHLHAPHDEAGTSRAAVLTEVTQYHKELVHTTGRNMPRQSMELKSLTDWFQQGASSPREFSCDAGDFPVVSRPDLAGARDWIRAMLHADLAWDFDNSECPDLDVDRHHEATGSQEATNAMKAQLDLVRLYCERAGTTPNAVRQDLVRPMHATLDGNRYSPTTLTIPTVLWHAAQNPTVHNSPTVSYLTGDDTYEVSLLAGITAADLFGWIYALTSRPSTYEFLAREDLHMWHYMRETPLPDHSEQCGTIPDLDEIVNAQFALAEQIAERLGTTLRAAVYAVTWKV